MLNYIAYLQALRLEKNKKWKPALAAYQEIAKTQNQPAAKLAYRIGFVAEKIKDWKTAETWLQRAVEADPSKAQWHYRLALAQELNKKFSLAVETYGQAIALQPKNPQYLYRLGKALWICGKGVEAETALHKAIQLAPKNPIYAYELAVAIRKQGRTWQEVEALQAALALDAGNAQWQFELGDAQDKMNRFAEAGQAFQAANSLKPGNAQWHFREGYAWERANKPVQAQSAYSAAIAADKNLKAKDFGIGVFHQQRGFWPQAAQAYEKQAKADPFNAELQYRLGLAHDRCYHWAQAEQCYQQALVFEPHKPDWYYRLGFVLERQDKLEQAAQMYEYAAATRASHTPYWFYRLGYVLQRAGKYQQACSAFVQTRTKPELDALPTTQAKHLRPDMSDEEQAAFAESYLQLQQSNLRKLLEQNTALHSTEQAQAYFQLGQQAEGHGMWQEAAQAYRQAVARSNNHNTLWYYRLGYVLVQLGLFEQASEAFVNSRIFQRPDGIDMSRYEKNPGLMQTMEYAEYLETRPVVPKTIVYESFLGASLSCNPYAIYKAIVDHPDFADFTHIWMVTSEAELPFDFQIRANTLFIQRQSSGYRRYLATAEYLINNVTFPYWFIRREGQKYLNTWHGTPIKGLGKDMPGEFYVHGNVTRNFLHATHLLSPNQHTSNAMMLSYDIAGIYAGKLAETGYPRIDSTLNSTPEEKQGLYEYLGLSTNKPIVVYAPTWRGLQGTVNTDVERILEDINGMVSEDYQLVFRGHHFAEKALASADIPVAVAGQNIDSNQLLAITDLLITDYSSIMFDYLPTSKPIIYYAYDLEEYSESRGLYFKLDTLPGTICRTINEVQQAIHEGLSQPEIYQQDERLVKAQNDYTCYENGHSTETAIEFFFTDSVSHLIKRYEDTRPVNLFFNGPFIPNGITSSFLNLMHAIGTESSLNVVALEAEKIKNNPGNLEEFNKLPEGLRYLAKSGGKIMTPEEKWIEGQFSMHRGLLSDSLISVFNGSNKREFARLFGVSNNIANVVNFEGYSADWLQLMAHAGKNNLAWMHSDMEQERLIRLPYLTGNFVMYPGYKSLVSVSAVMRDINNKALSLTYGLKDSQFIYCENTLDVEKIKASSKAQLEHDLERWMQGGPLFVTVGRLSPEKDQAKLIKAFSKFAIKTPQAKLVIVGDGPLRQQLEELIDSLNLQDSVLLAGQRSNPFPILKACDCFMLPSNHEGQPVVLLEALSLDKPIIATNINGNRGVVEKYGGTLVDNSVEGLLHGFALYISGEVNKPDFDVRKYQDSAISSFCEILES